MNIISEILNSKPNNQALLSHYLNDVKEYFKRVGYLNEEKTYSRILKIAESTQKYVPLLYSITNISMKLISLVRARVDDKFEDQKKQIEQSQSATSQIEVQNVQRTTSIDDEPYDNIYSLLNIKRESSRKQVNQDFLRKLVLDVVDQLKDEINQCQDFLLKQLSPALENSQNILVFDSYLTNKPIISKIAVQKNIKVTYVRTSGADSKNNEINLVDVPSKIRKYKKVIISGISTLKNGSVIAEPGSLMVSLAAKKYKVPLIVVSRGFGLTEKVLIDQHMLLAENPMKYYEKKQENMLKTHIAKKFDLIENTDIREIITQLGTISAVNIQMQFCTYYDYI